MAKFVTTGKNANIFHDPASGITVIRGDKKSLTPYQLNLPKVRKALNAGHLILVEADSEVETKPTPFDLDKLFSDLDTYVNKGMDHDSIAKKFSMDELKAMAERSEIEVEDGDTKSDIVSALVEDEE